MYEMVVKAHGFLMSKCLGGFSLTSFYECFSSYTQLNELFFVSKANSYTMELTNYNNLALGLDDVKVGLDNANTKLVQA